MALVVVLLHPREPGLDLADPEAELAADPEASRAPALATQVVDRLGIHLEVGTQLREGKDLLDQGELTAVRRVLEAALLR